MVTNRFVETKEEDKNASTVKNSDEVDQNVSSNETSAQNDSVIFIGPYEIDYLPNDGAKVKTEGNELVAQHAMPVQKVEKPNEFDEINKNNSLVYIGTYFQAGPSVPLNENQAMGGDVKPSVSAEPKPEIEVSNGHDQSTLSLSELNESDLFSSYTSADVSSTSSSFGCKTLLDYTQQLLPLYGRSNINGK